MDWQTARGAQLTAAERHWILTKSAETVGRHGAGCNIVHIGVDYGGSLVCSCAGADEANVIGVDLAVDHFEGPPEVELIKGDSGVVCRKFHRPVHLLFVDGDHERDGVHADMRGWLGKVRPGGIVAFHDYHQPEFPHVAGVREAVDAWDWAPTTWERVDAPDSLFAMRRLPFLRRGDGFGTIGIGTPFMRAPYQFFRWWSWLLIGGLEPGDQLLNDETWECPAPIPVSHNAIIKHFLETDRDTLCLVEDDHVGAQDVVRQMRNKAENRDFDMICASYVNRRGLPLPVGYNNLHIKDSGELEVLVEMADVQETGTQEHDGAAMGLILVRRWVLDAMLDGQDADWYQWCEWRGRNSQDLWFYYKAHQAADVRVGVDRDARLGHIGERVWTFDDFLDARARAKAAAAASTTQ